MNIFCIFAIFTILPTNCAFVAPNQIFKYTYDVSSSSALNLVPLSSFSDQSKRTFLTSDDSFRTCIDENGELRSDANAENGSNYVIAVAEEDDLPNISQLTINAFGADAITLSKDLSQLELTLLNPGIGAFNAYSGMVAYTEVLSGLRQRMRHRLNPDSVDDLLVPPPVMNIDDADAKDVAAKSSVILVLGREKESSSSSTGTGTGYNEIEAIATVELRLQPTDGKIPFSEPWFDRIERSVAKMLNMDVKPKDMHLQPYLSNLCVDESVRGRQIGKAMCRCVERIAKDAWGYDKIYLHVDLENVPALNLYKRENYEDVGSRWNPFWAGQASEIGYYYKNL
jgi:ribosomal protein S18 acetylase RimI-like enzyme